MSSLIIIDSGCANLNSVIKAMAALGLQPRISDNQAEIISADGIIFPGVGSFNHAARVIKEKKLFDPLKTAINNNIPLLGICLGMQLLFSESEESNPLMARQHGLGVIEGRVKRFAIDLAVPHVGWNTVTPKIDHPLFDGLNGQEFFYFTHSFYVQPELPKNILAQTEYGITFTSAVIKNNLFGVQFHPEKSGSAGLRLLANFGKIIADHNK